MIIIHGSSNPKLAQDIANHSDLSVIKAEITKFYNHEIKITIPVSVHDQDVVVVQSISNPANDSLIELLFLIDILRRQKAKTIRVIIPYFGYTRQDKESLNASSISLIAKLIEAAGADELITLDLHSELIKNYFKIEVHSLESHPIFFPYIKNIDNLVIVSPDFGGINRAQSFADFLKTPAAYIHKTRDDSGKCSLHDVIGSVDGKNCILIDDIIDTGNTICMAAEKLYQNGALSVIAFVTHGVFSQAAIENVENSSIQKLYVTDTIDNSASSNKIEIISSAGIFAKFLSLGK